MPRAQQQLVVIFLSVEGPSIISSEADGIKTSWPTPNDRFLAS